MCSPARPSRWRCAGAGRRAVARRASASTASSAVDLFRGENVADRPHIIVDITAVVRLGDGWQLYVRPWFRQPRRRRRGTRRSTRRRSSTNVRAACRRVLDLGYIVSPIGLGMLDTRPGMNPTIAPHLSYLVPMPAFDADRAARAADRVDLPARRAGHVVDDALGRPGGARQLRAQRASTSSTARRNPRATPVVVAGGGVTPTTGLRLGAVVRARRLRNRRRT